MQNLKIQLGLGVLAVLIAGGAFIMLRSSSTPPSNNIDTKTDTNSTVTEKPSTPTPKPVTTKDDTYTMTEVSTHSSASSCWTAINGNVYDVTSWIKAHPGGAQAILSLCGKDGSAAFNGQHGGQKRPEAELAGFIIGKLSAAL